MIWGCISTRPLVQTKGANARARRMELDEEEGERRLLLVDSGDTCGQIMVAKIKEKIEMLIGEVEPRQLRFATRTLRLLRRPRATSRPTLGLWTRQSVPLKRALGDFCRQALPRSSCSSTWT